MLNLRLAQPSLLVDITGIPELTGIEREAGDITIGACVTTADVEDGRIGADAPPMLAEVATRIAYRAVRNRGTVGGSLCHADPAADWVTALAALGAEAIIVSGRAERRVPVRRLITGAFETAVGPGEILRAIRIPMPSARARWGYYKVCRKAGEFALCYGRRLFRRGPGLLPCRAWARRAAPPLSSTTLPPYSEVRASRPPPRSWTRPQQRVSSPPLVAMAIGLAFVYISRRSRALRSWQARRENSKPHRQRPSRHGGHRRAHAPRRLPARQAHAHGHASALRARAFAVPVRCLSTGSPPAPASPISHCATGPRSPPWRVWSTIPSSPRCAGRSWPSTDCSAAFARPACW